LGRWSLHKPKEGLYEFFSVPKDYLESSKQSGFESDKYWVFSKLVPVKKRIIVIKGD